MKMLNISCGHYLKMTVQIQNPFTGQSVIQLYALDNFIEPIRNKYKISDYKVMGLIYDFLASNGGSTIGLPAYMESELPSIPVEYWMISMESLT